ncbi:MAG: hypothetical protein IJ347_05875 [Faecalibacterium sp.]|nr:hypothetical protein [Faecalibacterium sp.]
MSGSFPDNIQFYPHHPSPMKTRRIQTRPSPMLEGQTAPFEAAVLCRQFEEHLDESLRRYEDKRFDVTGIVIWVGRDIHDLPTVQLSDAAGGRCCVHCIFPTPDVLQTVKAGDRVVIRSNYLVMCNLFGVVMKYSELLNVEKPE